MFRALRLAAIGALALLPQPAEANPCLLCTSGGADGGSVLSGSGATAGAEPRPPIEIELSAGFNFRRFALPGPGGDMLVEAGRKSVAAALGGGYALVGQVVLRGAPHAAVSVELPRVVSLVSRGGARIDLAGIAYSLPRSPRLDANGRLEFEFTAPVNLPAGASPGDYRATFAIDAVYD